VSPGCYIPSLPEVSQTARQRLALANKVFDAAMDGNIAALIYLCKHHLGWGLLQPLAIRQRQQEAAANRGAIETTASPFKSNSNGGGPEGWGARWKS
jgi:hypothetical protein